mmetsp:Transcript_3511/g.4032  ORF Transcript_3511/g.4032 Transcript_3511/m.4032 type:complete len:103 (-) Transcript_3511:2021-2329(-)
MSFTKKLKVIVMSHYKIKKFAGNFQQHNSKQALKMKTTYSVITSLFIYLLTSGFVDASPVLTSSVVASLELFFSPPFNSSSVIRSNTITISQCSVRGNISTG